MKKNPVFRKNIQVLVAILLIYASIVTVIRYGNFEVKTKSSSLVVPVLEVQNTTYKLPKGIAYDNEYLWITSADVEKIYAVDPDTGNTVKQITLPFTDSWGLEWDGNSLWVVDAIAQKIVQVNATTGDIISSINTPGAMPSGLTWDGESFWVSDLNSHEIFKVDPVSGAVLEVFYAPTPIKNPSGLGWHNGNLWVTDLYKSYIFAIDPDTKQIVEYYYSPGNFPSDLAAEDEYFWILDYSLSKLYKTIPGEQAYTNTPVTVPTWAGTFLMIVLLPVILSIISDLLSPGPRVEEEDSGGGSGTNGFGVWVPSNFFFIVAVLGSMYASYELFRIIYSVSILNKPVTIGSYSLWLYKAEIFFCVYTLGFWVYYVIVRVLRFLKQPT